MSSSSPKALVTSFYGNDDSVYLGNHYISTTMDDLTENIFISDDKTKEDSSKDKQELTSDLAMTHPPRKSLDIGNYENQ